MNPRDLLARWNTPEIQVRRAIGILGVVLAAPLAWYYFVRFETSGHFEKDGPIFYRDIAANWRNWSVLTEDEIRTALRTGNLDEFHTYVLGAAMARWRVRKEAPALWDRIMEDYARGAWTTPPRARWEALFAEADAAWIAAREKALATRTDAERKALVFVGKPQPSFLRISFAEGTTTADVGTLVHLVYDDEATAAEYRLWAWWCVNQPGVSGFRQRQGRVYSIPGAPDGRTRRVHEFDMSQEPAWTAAEARPIWIDIRAKLDPAFIVGVEIVGGLGEAGKTGE